MSRAYRDFLESQPEEEYTDDRDWDAPGSGYFEFVNRDVEHIEPLATDGTEPDDYEGCTEAGLVQSALDLKSRCGWSVERIVERVVRELKAA